ncbi:hypothetical protein mRhiFer1_009353 [Rhinolophus ferrumequinum]|uniref:Uncharacterized protein n=1 Tax=Rhinolophus ferrumequinum TaxID=59479 RepID=A0A7J7RQ82_RHIFE|nr:hypothetical protein mRhiFer1_009353 [Rhinolophus ferrumequinum]
MHADRFERARTDLGSGARKAREDGPAAQARILVQEAASHKEPPSPYDWRQHTRAPVTYDKTRHRPSSSNSSCLEVLAVPCATVSGQVSEMPACLSRRAVVADCAQDPGCRRALGPISPPGLGSLSDSEGDM